MPDGVTSMFHNAEHGPPWHGKGVAVNGLLTAAEFGRHVVAREMVGPLPGEGTSRTGMTGLRR